MASFYDIKVYLKMLIELVKNIHPLWKEIPSTKNYQESNV